MAKTLLVVDHSRMSRIVIKTIINKHYPDWITLEACDAEEALEQQTKGHSVNIITVELDMPNTDGLALGKKLREQFPKADIALITANTLGNVQVEAEAANLNFITKPITEDGIMTYINTVGREDLNNLTLMEQDAITETFNIGICKAGAALSEMVGREVNLSVPELSIVTLQQAQQELANQQQEVSGVQEHFNGAVAGNALLIFPKHRCHDLIRLLYPDNISDEDIADMEEDTLVEVGNIILNACLASLSDIMQEELINQVPQAFNGQLKDVALGENGNDDQYVLQMHMTLSVKDLDVTGDISFLIILKSINHFRERLAIFFGLPLR